jgi:large subunit ribosomal protein L10
MALTRQKKQQQVEQLAGELKDSTSAIVGTFAKLTVAQDFALRRKVREAGGKYRVLKNKLAARASAGTRIEEALKGLKGVSSVAYTSGDPVALAKALQGWVADNAQFTFKLGIVDGKIISVDEIKSLATMPGKEELFSKLLFLISSPAQRLVTVVNAVGRDMAIVLDQGVKESKFAGGADEQAVGNREQAVASADVAAETESPKAEEQAETASVAEVPAAGTSTDPVEGATAEESAAPVETAEVAPEKQAEAAATEAPAEGAAS